MVCDTLLRYKAISPDTRRIWCGHLSCLGATYRAVGHGGASPGSSDNKPVPDGLSTDTHHRTRTTMESRGLSIVLDRSHFACAAVPDPGLARSSTRHRRGVAPCAGEPRSVFPTLPELALAFLCQPV